MNNDKKNWRQRWLSSINELTSLNIQKKSWVDNNTPNPHWSYAEFMCCYFDDLCLDDNYKYVLDKGWVTKVEYDILKEWHEALEKYEIPKTEEYNHIAILNDPKWLDIIKTGDVAKSKLTQLLTGDEITTLTEEKNIT